MASDGTDDRIDRIRALGQAWNAGATSGSDYHRALRACSAQIHAVLTDPQMGLPL